MTRYTVLWDENVQSQYIQAWIAGDFVTREVLTEIANWVDKNLVEDPDREGFARPDLSARIAVVPLASSSARVSVTFQVFPEDRQVRVVRLIFRL